MLIGSRAIAFWNKDFVVRPNADWDIIGTNVNERGYREKYSIPDSDRIEWHDPYHLNNFLVRSQFENHQSWICNPYGLSLIYRSHLHRDHNWDGHVTKYHKFLVPLIGNTDTLLRDSLLLDRIKLTKKAYPQGNPKLNQSNEDFFDDNVDKVYDHDFLHELYAYEDRPMFERLKHQGEEDKAWCAKDLWERLTLEQKLQCVAEETCVIATERYLVPYNWNFEYKRAYYRSLRKVCTTLCSGWFRDFAIDHFPQILEMYNYDRFAWVKTHLSVMPVYNIKYHNGE